MELWQIILLIVLAVIVGSGILFSIFCLFYISWRVYSGVLIRTKPEKWGRSCSAPKDPSMVEMWEKGLVWGEKYKENKREVGITNDGFKLVGEFFDFGFNRAVLILAGRTECCMYSYFYAEPYRAAGYNVLVIDTRSHGLSEGKYNTAGILESRDIIAWVKFLHDELKQESVVTHAICVGGSGAIIAATSEQRPSYWTKLVFDGLFISFEDSFATHMKDEGHGKSPIFYMIWFWFKIKTGCSVNDAVPYKYADKINMPVLFLHGKEDKFSLPNKSQKLFDKCTYEQKQVKWFEHGAHSRLRLINEKEYDETVINFVK